MGWRLGGKAAGRRGSGAAGRRGSPLSPGGERVGVRGEGP